MSNILDGIIYDAIFPSTLNLTAVDLNYRGMYSAGGGNFPADTTKGYWYLINIQGTLPAPCGFCPVGSAIVYSGTQWEKGQVMASGVSVVNGLSGAVVLTPDNISDASSSKKFTTSADISKLAGIESGAQKNLTPAQLKVAYESNANTNALTDAMATKLNSVESNAQENKIEVVKLNGVPLTIDGLKGVDIVIGSVFRFVGTTPTVASLNLIPSPQTGDTWNVVENGINYSWNGTEWSPLGGSIDLTAFYTKSETYSKLEVDTVLGDKVDKVIGKQLSTEDYSTVEKAKLVGIEAGAQANTSRVKVSLTDTVEGELEHKIIAGTNITINKIGSGTDEQLEISASGGASGVVSVNGYNDVVVLTKADVGLANVTNNQQLPMSYLDTDAILSANSDIRVSSQKAVKSYIDGLSAINSHGVINLPTITDNLNGSVTIGTDGVILFYKDALGATGLVKLSVVNGATLTLTDNAQNYVYCSYNAGVPTYMVTTNQNIFYPNASLTPVIRITREGNELYLNDYANYGLAQSGKILLKDTIENGFRRNSGLDLTTTSTRQIQVSAGACWFGVNPVSVPQSISGDVSTAMYEYYRVGGVWTKSANLSEFDATYYSNGTDRLTLADGNWVSKYIFKNIGTKNEIYYISGNTYDSKAGAFAENFPTVPSFLLGHSLYVGKIVIQKNQALGTAYGRNYTGYVTTGTISSHDDFSNIQGTGSGIKTGHISDVAQTIYGDKTFINNITTNENFISSLTGDNVITNTSVKTALQNIDNTYTITKNSTGFTNNDTININYDSTARTISLTGTFEAYFRGKKVAVLTNGWVSSSHATGLAKYYLYYNGSAFVWSTTVPSEDMLRIADVYYNTVEKFAVRRTFGFMQPETRKDLHKNIGLYAASGGTLSGYTLSSNVDTNRRPSIALTEIVDEDLTTLSPAHTSQLYTKMYLTASGTSNFTVETSEIVPLNGNQPYYNQLVAGTWQQTLLPANNYMSVWLVALPVTSDTNSQKYRYIWVQGQSISSGLSTIQSKTPADVNLGTLPSMTSEYIFLAKVIIQYVSGNWIIVQADLLRGNRFSQTMIYGSPTVTSVNSITPTAGNVVLTQDNIGDGSTYKQYSEIEKTKLSNITGTNTGDETTLSILNKIGDGSKISSTYLPSYVDDVLEFANVASFPATGETGKIYIALDVNLTYRWGGSGYVEISPSIALGETSATAYRGDRGASAYAHSILADGTNPHQTTFANIASKPTTIAGYGITNGVTLTGTETLTNKTLTAPVLNTEITGTGITTTGEANKLIKVDSGNIVNVPSLYCKGGMFFGTNTPALTATSAYIRSSNGYSTPTNPDYSFWYNDNTGIYHPSADNLGISTEGVSRALFDSRGLTLPNLAGTGVRMVVADSDGSLSASSIFLRGSVAITSGSTITITIPQVIPNNMYAIFLTVDRADYDGVVTCTSRDRLTNEFKIHYYAGDGSSAVVHWLLSY